jgi:pimeloyl-ACP methyl ester carboxylesterase
MGDGSIPHERFAAISAPTAVLTGGASPDWFRAAGRAAAAAIPDATYRELPGETHDVAPGVLAAAVHEVTAYARRP